MSDQVRINGNIYSWSSAEIHINGSIFRGITAINYSQTRERTKGFGSGNHRGARGRTKGKYECEADFTMQLDSFESMTDQLASMSPDGLSYGDVPFQVVVQYVEIGLRPVTIEIEDCVITGDSSGETEGTDPSVVEVTLDTMKIRRNGKSLSAGETV